MEAVGPVRRQSIRRAHTFRPDNAAESGQGLRETVWITQTFFPKMSLMISRVAGKSLHAEAIDAGICLDRVEPGRHHPKKHVHFAGRGRDLDGSLQHRTIIQFEKKNEASDQKKIGAQTAGQLLQRAPQPKQHRFQGFHTAVELRRFLIGFGDSRQPQRTQVSTASAVPKPQPFGAQPFGHLLAIQGAQVADCEAQNPYWQQFGSAIDSVTTHSVPVHLQYADLFMLEPGTTDVIQKLTVQQFNADGYTDVHYPDAGIALFDAYAQVGNPLMDYPEQAIGKSDEFKGWQAFVLPKVVPDQP